MTHIHRLTVRQPKVRRVLRTARGGTRTAIALIVEPDAYGLPTSYIAAEVSDAAGAILLVVLDPQWRHQRPGWSVGTESRFRADVRQAIRQHEGGAWLTWNPGQKDAKVEPIT